MAQAPCFFCQLASARVNEIKVFGIFSSVIVKQFSSLLPFPKNWLFNSEEIGGLILTEQP